MICFSVIVNGIPVCCCFFFVVVVIVVVVVDVVDVAVVVVVVVFVFIPGGKTMVCYLPNYLYKVDFLKRRKTT